MDTLIVPTKLEIDAAGLTHVGQQREVNEDQFLVATLERQLRIQDTSIKANALNWLPSTAEGTLLIVADGMGGAEGGEVASCVAVREVADYLCSVLPIAESMGGTTVDGDRMTIPGLRDGLESALVAGDARVRQTAEERKLSPDMGTTVTVAYISWPNLYVGHVGDSRCYLLHGGALELLTADHTFAERLKEHTDVEIGADSPLHHVLWNVVGGGKTEGVRPEISRRFLHPSDTLMLCSDGVTKHVDDERITVILREAATSAEACERLVAEANEGGGSDNITAVVARRKRSTSDQSLEGPTKVVLPEENKV